VPPQGRADYAFQQHILQSLKPQTGRSAVLWPHGVLFRDAENDIRRKMIEADLIECIVGLGPNLFYNSSMPSCIVICRTAKPKARKGKILLINAVNEVTRERAQSFLTDEHLSRIVDAYRDFKGEDHFARVVTIEEVRENHCNLNLQFYITPATSTPRSSTSREQAVTEAIANWIASSAQVTDALSGLTHASIKPPRARKLQIGNTKHLLDGRSSWRRVRLGDLLEKTEAVERDPLAAGFERYLMVEHMDANSLRIERWGNIADDNIPPTFYKVFRRGQILYPTRNPHLRRAALAGFDGICGEKTLTLSVREGFDAKFVPWIFQSESFIEFATNRKIGSTNPHVRWRDIADFEFDLPPLDQQRRIADILWAMDGCVQLFEQILHRLVSLKHETLIELKESTEFQVKRGFLGEFIKLTIGGGTPSRLQSEFWNGSIPWMTVKDMTESGYVSKTEEQITQAGLNSSAASLIEPNSIVLATRIALGKVVRNTIPLAINQDLRAIFPTKEVSPSFLFYWIQSSEKEIIRNGAGTTVKGIRLDQLKKLPFNLLTQDAQDAYVFSLNRIDEAIETLNKNLTSLRRVHNLVLNNSLVNNHV
jgi:restriction endonuclease S subunit